MAYSESVYYRIHSKMVQLMCLKKARAQGSCLSFMIFIDKQLSTWYNIRKIGQFYEHD